MYYFNGQLNSLATNGISYDDFRKGFFFGVYDLSTSAKCGTNYVVPAIRVGHFRMRYFPSLNNLYTKGSYKNNVT